MDYLIDNHFNKLLCGDIKGAFSDYSKKIICIAHVNGKSETLTGKAAAHLLWNMAKVLSLGSKQDVQVLMNRSTQAHGVLTLKNESFSPFLSYTCIVKNGKIAYMTMYVYKPAYNILPHPLTPMPKGKLAKKLFHKHVLAMLSVNADVIVKDYAPNAVVITNMAEDTCNGRQQIHSFCGRLMKSSLRIIKKLRIHGFPKIKWQTKSAADGLLLFVCEAEAFGSIMTETYWVENGKIQFETSVCSGEVLELIRTSL